MKTQQVLCISAIAFLILLSACGQPDSVAQSGSSSGQQATNQSAVIAPTQTTAVQAPTEQAKDEVVTKVTEGSYIITIRSLEDRVAQSDVIVVGEIVGIGKIFNAARDPQDRTKSATNVFGVGQEYQLRVKQYLKGNGPNDLTVVEDEGVVFLPPEVVTAPDIEQARSLDDSLLFQQGATYLLFLDHTTIFDGRDYYAGFDEPWRYLITPEGQAMVETPEQVRYQLAADLQSTDTSALIPKVEQLVTAERATQATP